MVIVMMIRVKKGIDNMQVDIFSPYGLVQEYFSDVYVVVYDTREKKEKVAKFSPSAKLLKIAYFEASAVFVRNNTAVIYLAHPLRYPVESEPEEYK
jgi:hypothetical protein